jgi:hydroxyethylthiazole kinase-like uncharacterized protein yjeF
MKVVTAEEMRHIDRMAGELGVTTEMLMENAGRAVAEEVRKAAGSVVGKRVLVLVGPGNNGGDGLVAGRYLSDWGAEVVIYLCAQRPSADKNLALVMERGLALFKAWEDDAFRNLGSLLGSSEVVVDAVLGTGKSRSLEGVFKEVLGRLVEFKATKPDVTIVAVDIPSGLDADSGAADPNCPYADITVTLGYPKVGLYNFPGAERAGKVVVADIGIPPELAEGVKTELITEQWVRSVLPRRPRDANKGTFGRILVVAGSVNYIGAAYLACMGAARVGAGLVTLATARSLQSVLAAKLTETTYLPLPEAGAGIIAEKAVGVVQDCLPDYDVLLLGCGLGQKPSVVKFVKSLLLGTSRRQMPAVVIDADGLNILSRVPRWWRELSSGAILTPHPGEMARLVGCTVTEVQQRRVELAREKSAEWQQVVVLKGAYTVVAAPDGRVKISQIANPGLASAGTGDVLSGAIAGLLAQRLSPFDAAACGVYLHAEAGEMVKREMGDAGMLASDLLPALPMVIKRLKEMGSGG